ncbi:response regulator [Granulibacter bethesdensis]|uniref:Transcriptional regulatory protein ompR n=1 Tax=Granulibacter bethesdensis (strain ATCC BAA-1260 / CGDNIH1) TaxID=391165 RepID=Q0BPW3_GRABC|nr:response regulator [Granulibacter bethesdensis]ABI63139.1 Transcriptional regulatory protein ompR [Granulibacter bethesdensis CGDNIH1]APH53015.1 Transcriptional regulatory protein ompR [Granulibacter bethesdensis]APH65703.1 Transcriptional regulatory protein ompR [Granulibacter bethesdensis]
MSPSDQGGGEATMILVVDDDDRLRRLLSRFLAERGFRVITAENATIARQTMGFLQPDLIVLDVMMAGEDGLSLTESLRQDGQDVPVILLTARGAPEDRIAGLEAGADDYLAKPFEPDELVARIRAVLRRTSIPATPPAPTGPVKLGQIIFDPDRSELRGPDGATRLTGGETALLAALAGRANEVLSREELAAVLSMDEASERAIDVQVTRLRRKIETDPREPRYLHTVRGRGYVLKPGP